MARQPLPDDERGAIDRHVRELDRLAEDLDILDREIARDALDDQATKRLMTITGVNLTVAAGIMAAIGDIGRFKSPGKLVSYFGLNPRVRQSGLGAAHHGRISKIGRSHARAMLVEAAWAAAKTAGPLHAFFVRVRARRGHQIAAVAVARKLTVLCWHLLTKDKDYLWARPALIANKTRAMELAGRQATKKGQPPRASLCLQREETARPGDANRRAGRAQLRPLRGAMENKIAERWGARAPQSGKAGMRHLAAFPAVTPRFATRSPAQEKIPRRT